MMSKTPRTDAILQTLDDPWGKPISNDIIRAITKDISSLEIELTEVTCRRDAYKKALEMAEDELMTARVEIERKDKLIEQMKKLLKAVECSEFEGPICFDVDGKNWYNAREAALSAAERGE